MQTRRAFVYVILTGAFTLALAVGGALWSTPVHAQTVTADLTTGEAEALQFMREEEKLARDVYLTLDEQWNLRVFENISKSEQTHMDAVKGVLDNYGIEDPAAGNDIGVFTNPDLQTLYDQLIADGGSSLTAALEVGVAIEEIDILDLQERLAETDKTDIQLVYANLLRGSGNHLRAFVRNLERQTGETVQPQYMDQATYDELLASNNGRGNRNGKRGRWGYDLEDDNQIGVRRYGRWGNDLEDDNQIGGRGYGQRGRGGYGHWGDALSQDDAGQQIWRGGRWSQ